MITKVTSKLTPIVKQPIRANLQKTAAVGLAALAGSSMSGWHSPHFTPTEMIIPGGLDFKEKAYFLLKGKLPPSVYERWVSHSSDYIPTEGDQVVTVNIGEGRYIGDIIEPPHKVGTTPEHFESLNTDISQDIISASEIDLARSDVDIYGGGDGDGEMSKIDILRRFLGQY